MAGQVVAQFKLTVLMTAHSAKAMTVSTFDPDICQSEKNISDEEIKNILSFQRKTKKADKRQKHRENTKEKKAKKDAIL